MDVRVEPERRLSTKELMPSNYGAEKDSWRVPWTARGSNQSILKEISPEYSLEGLTLKLQHFGHLMQRVNSVEKTLRPRKIESRRRRAQQRIRSLDSITDSMDVSPWGHKELDMTEQLNTHTHRDIYNLTFPTILHHSSPPMPIMLQISPYYKVLPTYLPWLLLLWTHPICSSFIYELVQMPLSP